MEMNFDQLVPVILTQDTPIKPFKCADEDLNGFLFEDAKKYLSQRLAVTYLFEDRVNGKTAAYYSMAYDKITAVEAASKKVWNALNRSIPNPNGLTRLQKSVVWECRRNIHIRDWDLLFSR